VGRDATIRALSEEGLEGNEDLGLDYRERYGNRAFDQYMAEESQRDEASNYGADETEGVVADDEEAPLAIEY